MKIMRALLCLGMMLALGCNKGEGLVLVTLTASPALTNISSLHITMTVGETTHSREIFDVPTIDSRASTFGIDVSPSYGSSIVVEVQAVDALGASLGTGSGTAPIEAGKQTNIEIVLVGTGALVGSDMSAGGSGDMAGATTGGDLGEVDGADLSVTPICIFDSPTSKFDNCIMP